MWALHTCDVLGCVQPLHLYWGTRQNNTQDAVDRNRYKHGEQHHNAKLTIETVRSIKMMLQEGMTVSKVAKRLNVPRASVYMIYRGLSWRHVQ